MKNLIRIWKNYRMRKQWLKKQEEEMRRARDS